MEKRHSSMTSREQLMVRKRVIEEVLARTDWTPAHAVGYIRSELGLTTEEFAKLSGVPSTVIEGVEQNGPPGTVEEFSKLLGVLGLKLGVVKKPPAGSELIREAIPESRETERRIGIAKGIFEVPCDISWRPEELAALLGLNGEPGELCSSDSGAWAEVHAQAVRNRTVAKLQSNRPADEILQAAGAEQRELGNRVTALMASLAQHGSDLVPRAADARLVREQRKLLVLQLSDCPSSAKSLADSRWLARCWSHAVIALGASGFPIEDLPDDNPWDAAALLADVGLVGGEGGAPDGPG